MELTNITLKNFRAHRSASFDFSNGVTAIIGGNGSGKSSIVEAILFLLTGEGYGKTKAEMLTVGQTSGWVVGRLLIDGKEAVLERHIDTAKVNFLYEGKTYKKSSEVHEIWDKLFQIDKNIVQNVIVSNQGEIATLFNGDSATKEKLFQKIFMVPNTSKIRDVLWNNYIKEAPPEYPVKDNVLLTSDIQCLEQLVVLAKEQLASVSFDSSEYDALVTRKAFLVKVEENSEKLVRLQDELGSLQADFTSHKNNADNLREKMKSINIQEYRSALAEQKANKKLYEAKQELEAKKIAIVPPKESIDRELLQQLKQAETTLEADLRLKRTKVAELNKQISDYEKSDLASGTCPTCGTKVDSVVKLIEHIEKEREPIIVSGKQQKEELQKLQQRLSVLTALASEWDAYEQELTSIAQSLAKYTVVSYNEEAAGLYEAVVNKYHLWETKLADLSRKERESEQALNSKQLQLASLVTYDKDPVEFTSEKIAVAAKIADLQKAQEEKKKYEIEIAGNEREIKSLKKELEDNNSYILKNNKRAEYVSVLKGVYDLFHSGKFPRALIQTYSSTVTDYMNEVLENFNFPYKAKVNEVFGIDVFNEDGLELPAISGGQQVMVGFSLRLALHNMFVGAFPFMIIDEGSYGLNSENAKKYFEIIKTLGKTSKFKQVIVIDHHTELSDYVDNTINL
jgi:DNA repair exonuclease SbcCD ATPase subunit